MNAKSLLVAAAAMCAGSVQAQVFSANAGGYVNVLLTPGFNLVGNPLQSADSSLAVTYRNIIGAVPPGLKVFAFDTASGAFHQAATYRGAPFNRFDPPSSASLTVPLGSGVFVFDPRPNNSEPLTLSFIGEVAQGTLNNPIPQGFSIKASMTPQPFSPTDIPAAPGDKIFKFNKTTGAYDTFTRRGAPFNRWEPALPTFAVAEAFFYYRPGTAATWARTFTLD